MLYTFSGAFWIMTMQGCWSRRRKPLQRRETGMKMTFSLWCWLRMFRQISCPSPPCIECKRTLAGELGRTVTQRNKTMITDEQKNRTRKVRPPSAHSRCRLPSTSFVPLSKQGQGWADWQHGGSPTHWQAHCFGFTSLTNSTRDLTPHRIYSCSLRLWAALVRDICKALKK